MGCFPTLALKITRTRVAAGILLLFARNREGQVGRDWEFTEWFRTQGGALDKVSTLWEKNARSKFFCRVISAIDLTTGDDVHGNTLTG